MVGYLVKQAKVSNNVIRRLPRYLRKLDELKAAGVDRISSGELGRQMGLTSSQIRQDFSCFGEFGQQGYGYNVTGLRGEIASILGMNRDFSVILVGVGNIGRAMIENFCFEQYGFHLVAAYDVRPEVVGTDISGIRVHDISELPRIFDTSRVDLAVLSVPKLIANKAARELVEHGVKFQMPTAPRGHPLPPKKCVPRPAEPQRVTEKVTSGAKKTAEKFGGRWKKCVPLHPLSGGDPGAE